MGVELIKFGVGLFVGLGLLIALLWILVWWLTFHPADIQSEAINCSDQVPLLKPGQRLKVMTYNVQYMAGKNYVFFYDLPDNAGPDERPSPEDITKTINEVARIIRAESPDIILLQEVDHGSARTDFEDQLARLLTLLSADYGCHTSAFYWQARFVPHARIKGAIGHKLSVISKYRISEATRYQLPRAATDPLTRQFSPKQALLETSLPTEDGGRLAVLTTHLDVSGRGRELKQREIAAIKAQLARLDQTETPWLLGGDFNLLPPGQLSRLRKDQQLNFRPDSEIGPLFDAYGAVPASADVSQDDTGQWLTMNPNDPSLPQPDRTLDYVFYADLLTLVDGYVRQHDTLTISDHLPLIAKFELP